MTTRRALLGLALAGLGLILPLGLAGCGGEATTTTTPDATSGTTGPKLPGVEDANIDVPKKGAAKK